MRYAFRSLLVLFGVTAHDPAVEVAAHEIADNDDAVEGQDAAEIGAPVIQRSAGVEISIGNAVREAAHDEERHTEEHGQIVSLAGEGNGGGHDESAADGKQTTIHESQIQAALQQCLCRFLQGHGAQAGEDAHSGAADDVAQQHQQHHAHLIPGNESGCAGVETELVADNGDKGEGEDNAACQEIAR